MNWQQLRTMESRLFSCGHCGNAVASSQGFHTSSSNSFGVYICPHCSKPSWITNTEQVPGPTPGSEVDHLPDEVESLYREARNCVSVGSYTSAVLACRKLLMNIAVSQGAEENKSFYHYVEYLATNGYVPPNGRGWVDHIRLKGNEATHEIAIMSQQDADDLILFSEMLLKFIYEFPNRIPPAA